MNLVFIIALNILNCGLAYSQVSIEGIERAARGKNADEAIKLLAEFYQDPSKFVEKEKEKEKEKDREAIKKIADSIFNTFYTEKAMNYYEVARHLYFKEPTEAQASLEKAFGVESQNGKVFLLWSRLLIRQDNCGPILEKIKTMLRSFSDNQELLLVQGQTLACLKQGEELKKWFADNVNLEAVFAKYFAIIKIKYHFQLQELNEVKRWIDILRRHDSNFPELLYWDWKVSGTNEEDRTTLAKKYITRCEKLTDAERRQLIIEPTNCNSIKETKEIQKNV